MARIHPTRTARRGHPRFDTITHGLHADIAVFPEAGRVYCRNCGFICNTARDDQSKSWDLDGFTITSNNQLTNGSFEDWTVGSPDSWTVSGNTVTQETTDGFYDWRDDGSGGGVSSAKLVRSGSDISLSQSESTPSDYNDIQVSVRASVKSTTNQMVRLKLSMNGTDYYSNYNVAQQRFQELTITEKAPAVVSSLTVYILADSSDGTAYVDDVILVRDSVPPSRNAPTGCPLCGSHAYNNASPN